MKISFKGDYALKIILDLALTYNGEITHIKDISKRQDIPEKFLEQIIVILKRAKYVKTVRGPKGGVFLAKHPSKITLGEIVRLIDGSTAPIACVSCSAYLKCSFENKCVFKKVWAEARERTNDIVDKTTFRDMVKDATKMEPRGALEYSI
ncbi:MAG: Rrf2 family transcriptional regulator [Endomicrobiia bacterium]|nr:Rrf2 family transcriptional regulator [Endomicrobiia bacterium]